MVTTLTRAQSRQIDRLAITQYGISGRVLMENAGRGVAELLLAIDPRLVGSAPVLICCGKGNNGGDGLVIARHLEIRGARAKVVLLAEPAALDGDALANYQILKQSGAMLRDLSAVPDVAAALTAEGGESTWIVDAMLGTGATGEPRAPIAAAIRWSNAQPAQRLAVDLPSGLDCDTGVPSEVTFCADHTATLVAAKQGFLADTAQALLGQVHVVSIGIPACLLQQISASEAAGG
jgi:NAD(P)H-hydrate epimerase